MDVFRPERRIRKFQYVEEQLGQQRIEVGAEVGEGRQDVEVQKPGLVLTGKEEELVVRSGPVR